MNNKETQQKLEKIESAIFDLKSSLKFLEDRVEAIEEYDPEDDDSICAQIGHTWTQIGELEWSDNLGEMTWDEAVKMAEKLDARLPERWEMIKAVDENYEEIQKLTKNDEDYYFWSATESSAANAWFVNLSNGNTYNNNKSTNSYQVRAVREIEKDK